MNALGYVSAMVGSVIQTNVVIAQIGMAQLGYYVQYFFLPALCLGFLVVTSECIYFLNFLNI